MTQPHRAYSSTGFSHLFPLWSKGPYVVGRGSFFLLSLVKTTVSACFFLCPDAPESEYGVFRDEKRRIGLDGRLGGLDDVVSTDFRALLTIRLQKKPWVVVPLVATVTARTSHTPSQGTTVVSPIPRCAKRPDRQLLSVLTLDVDPHFRLGPQACIC